MAEPKSFHLSSEIHAYLLDHSSPVDGIQQDLIAETQSLGGISIMQIAPEQGTFMTMLTRLVRARDAVEIGTFTGYSSLAIARGLPDDGTLLCCDVSDEWTAMARRYWDRAGRVRQDQPRDRTGGGDPGRPAPTEQFDLAFIDADKPGYIAYYEELLPRLRPGGVILVDNVLFHGGVDRRRQPRRQRGRHPGVQRPRPGRRSGRHRHAGHRRRPHLHHPALIADSSPAGAGARQPGRNTARKSAARPDAGGAERRRGQVPPAGDGPVGAQTVRRCRAFQWPIPQVERAEGEDQQPRRRPAGVARPRWAGP